MQVLADYRITVNTQNLVLSFVVNCRGFSSIGALVQTFLSPS
jgi:hypothetical protein